MKKTVLLVIALMFVFQITVFAEIRTDANDMGTTLTSTYSVEYEVKGKEEAYKCTLWFYTVSMRVFGTMGSMEDRSMMMYTASNEKDQSNKLLVMSKKNPPKFEAVTNNKVIPVSISKIKGIGNENIEITLKDDVLKTLNAADFVYLIFPTNDNGLKKFEIPKDIVGEWVTVLGADLKKVRKEIMES